MASIDQLTNPRLNRERLLAFEEIKQDFTIHPHYKIVHEYRKSMLPLQLCEMLYKRKQFIQKLTK